MVLRTLMDTRRMLYALLTRGDGYPQAGDWIAHRKTGARERILRRQWDGTVGGESIVKFVDGNLQFVPTDKLKLADESIIAREDR